MIGFKKAEKILLLIFTLSAQIVNAQFYNQGSDPASIKWRSITSDKFQIIYPEHTDSLARRYLFQLESDIGQVNKLQFIIKKPFPVILHPFNVNSNGLVVWAPKRAEFITTPPPTGGYSQLWDKQLSLHEQRHIFQMLNFERGLFKPLSYLFGEQVAGLGVGLYLSKWELEGDAVVSETEFSNSGRGRDPEFLLYYKAAFLSGDKRRLQNWSLGTLEFYEPDHYSFGYYFLSNLRYEFGNNVFERMLNYRLKYPLDFNGSNNSYQKITGLKNKIEIFKHIQKKSIDEWQKEDSSKGPYTKFKEIVKGVKNYENYSSLSLFPNDIIAAVRSDLDKISEIGIIDTTGIFRKLTNAGIINSCIKTSQHSIYWSESVPSTRWEQLSYSRIVEYDLQSNVRRYLTGKDRFYNPVPFNERLLAVVEYSIGGTSSIVFIDKDSGKRVKNLRIPFEGQIKEVVACDNVLYFSFIDNSGINLCSYDTNSGICSKIIRFEGKNISQISTDGKTICFESDFDGRNNIFSYNPNSKEFKKLTNSRFAAIAPVLNSGGNLIYLNYDIKGYHPVEVFKENFEGNRERFQQQGVDKIAEELSRQSEIYDIQSNDDSLNILPSKKFVKTSHLLNIHSWSPIYYDVDELQTEPFSANEIPVKPGFMLMSQDLLSTTFAMAGYSYNNGFNAGHFRLKYRGLFPVIEVKADFNERKSLNYYREELEDGKFAIKSKQSNHIWLNTRAQVYLPLNFSKGGRSRFLIPLLGIRYNNDSYLLDNDKNSTYMQIITGIQYYDVKNMAKRNIYPNNGFGLYGRYSETPGTGRYFGSMIYLSGYIYLPGVAVNQGLKVTARYQKQYVDGKYFYQDNVSSFVRGYDNFYADEICSLGFNYVIPFYVSQHVMLSTLYIKRVQIIPFYDFATYVKHNTSGQIQSYGTDVLADFHLFGISFPFSGGFRYLLRDDKKSSFQFLLNMSL